MQPFIEKLNVPERQMQRFQHTIIGYSVRLCVPKPYSTRTTTTTPFNAIQWKCVHVGLHNEMQLPNRSNWEKKMVFRGFSSEYSERSGIELTKINRIQRKLLAFLLKFKRKNLSKLNRRIFNLSSSWNAFEAGWIGMLFYFKTNIQWTPMNSNRFHAHTYLNRLHAWFRSKRDSPSSTYLM